MDAGELKSEQFFSICGLLTAGRKGKKNPETVKVQAMQWGLHHWAQLENADSTNLGLLTSGQGILTAEKILQQAGQNDRIIAEGVNEVFVKKERST